MDQIKKLIIGGFILDWDTVAEDEINRAKGQFVTFSNIAVPTIRWVCCAEIHAAQRPRLAPRAIILLVWRKPLNRFSLRNRGFHRDPRQIVQYKDLDAPDDAEPF